MDIFSSLKKSHDDNMYHDICEKNIEIKNLRAEIDSLNATYRDSNVNIPLQEEINHLRQDKWELLEIKCRMIRTLEQYEKDERENYARVQRVEHENRRLRDKIVEISTRNVELERELKMYKAFFVGNDVRVFLKDKDDSLGGLTGRYDFISNPKIRMLLEMIDKQIGDTGVEINAR